ncbi:hypothetical protein NVP1121O_096 [Vibrio phage 1.121.O._10N.286.46.C4]|nr:hypothetical protein NVP1121O_096 [Vibrio phage 1.121.O._10N.286.46.C4]
MEKVYSKCGEIFNTDYSDFEVGETVYEGDRVDIKPSDMVYSSTATLILESMDEFLYETVGESAPDFYMSDTDKLALNKLIRDFMDEHTEVGCFGVENTVSYTLTEEMIK